MSYDSLKRSHGAFKGHFNRCMKRFNSLIGLQAAPTLSSVEAAYLRLQKQLESLFTSTETLTSFLEEGKFEEGVVVDAAAELLVMNKFHDELIEQQTKVEEDYAKFKESQKNITPTGQTANHTPSTSTHVPTPRSTVKLKALDPPTWNGRRADFF